MIQEILIKNSPIFKKIQIQLDDGFNVFSGASGVGKSVLMESILALFGHKDSNASVIEAHFNIALDLESWGIDSDEDTILSILKKDKTRYFINSQSISKHRVLEITSSFVKYLGSRYMDFEEGYLRHLLDLFISQKNTHFKKQLQLHQDIFKEYSEILKKYTQLLKEEEQIEELKEFARFEIQKISSIAPKIGEYDSLMEKKRLLSKCEKIGELSQEVESFIETGSIASQFLNLLNRDAVFIEDALLELKNIIEEEKNKLEELLETDAGEILERISLLSDIRKRYGGELEALEILKKKQEELQHYENLTFSKEQLQQKLDSTKQKLDSSAENLHQERVKNLKKFEKAFNEHLKILHLRESVFELNKIHNMEYGYDTISFKLQTTELKNISAGEFSRVRLALLALEVSFEEKVGILILDEVDANLSGEESEGVAKILNLLAQSYQILAISHQPHMPTLCNRHFLVYKHSKDEQESHIQPLDKKGQIQEIARMISGQEITQEAIQFAEKRLSNK
ncbi:hypothetical protein CCZ01_07760 [Helicobacter monodelphidis]|uniref:hypothetical protein n=1 Tax=Helicobacter sp. 15-1451 TaxID=2004995 RepID=UPI000DCBC447|nr:hypothetical protein [Helicobacter sp. 15-1451]RAX56940.1 hypothetical protein CCZ01_07760 [Helicobacter sp. 15-1451]